MNKELGTIYHHHAVNTVAALWKTSDTIMYSINRSHSFKYQIAHEK